MLTLNVHYRGFLWLYHFWVWRKFLFYVCIGLPQIWVLRRNLQLRITGCNMLPCLMCCANMTHRLTSVWVVLKHHILGWQCVVTLPTESRLVVTGAPLRSKSLCHHLSSLLFSSDRLPLSNHRGDGGLQGRPLERQRSCCLQHVPCRASTPSHSRLRSVSNLSPKTYTYSICK